MISKNDLEYLARCLELAQEALDKGDEQIGRASCRERV